MDPLEAHFAITNSGLKVLERALPVYQQKRRRDYFQRIKMI
jgi:hypothetical protein